MTLHWCNKSNAASVIISRRAAASYWVKAASVSDWDSILCVCVCVCVVWGGGGGGGGRWGGGGGGGVLKTSITIITRQILHNQHKSDMNGTSNCNRLQ